MNDPNIPPRPKWHQKNGVVLLFVALFIILAIISLLYLRGIDPVIAEFYIFQLYFIFN